MIYKIYYFFVKRIIYIFFKIMYNIKVEGAENIPKNENIIYASNHRTNLDPPLIVVKGRGTFSFMAKEELFHKKAFALLIRSLGAFPVVRGKGDTSVIDTAVEKLEKGHNLVIFPEGTRSKDGKVQKGHSGVAVVAARTKKKILPVGIIFTGELKFRSELTLRYGKLIDPSEYIEDFENPNPRQLVKLKNRCMEEIKLLVEGNPEAEENKNE